MLTTWYSTRVAGRAPLLFLAPVYLRRALAMLVPCENASFRRADIGLSAELYTSKKKKVCIYNLFLFSKVVPSLAHPRQRRATFYSTDSPPGRARAWLA